MLSKILLSVMLIAISIHANIENVVKNTNDELVVEVSTEYVLGDQDTRISAKAIAIQNAKVLASEYAGTYVESELVLNNDTIIKDKIATITMAFLSTKIISEEYAITQDGRTKLAIRLQATLDKNVFNKKLEAIRTDETKVQELDRLKKDNERLNAELAELSKAILSIQSIKDSTDMSVKSKNSAIYAQRERVLKSLSNNQKKAVSIIDGQSLKEQIAQIREEKEESEQRLITDIENDLYDNIILAIKNNTKYSISEKPIIVNGRAVLKVTWTMDPIVSETLYKYFGSRVLSGGYRELGSKFIEMPGTLIVSDRYVGVKENFYTDRSFTKYQKIAFEYLIEHLIHGNFEKEEFLLGVEKQFKADYSKQAIFRSYGGAAQSFRTDDSYMQEFYLDHCIEEIPDSGSNMPHHSVMSYISLTSRLGNTSFGIRTSGSEYVYFTEKELDFIYSTTVELKTKEEIDKKSGVVYYNESTPRHSFSEREAIKKCLESRHQKIEKILWTTVNNIDHQKVKYFMRSREQIESKLNMLLPVPKEWQEH